MASALYLHFFYIALIVTDVTLVTSNATFSRGSSHHIANTLPGWTMINPFSSGPLAGHAVLRNHAACSRSHSLVGDLT